MEDKRSEESARGTADVGDGDRAANGAASVTFAEDATAAVAELQLNRSGGVRDGAIDVRGDSGAAVATQDGPVGADGAPDPSVGARTGSRQAAAKDKSAPSVTKALDKSASGKKVVEKESREGLEFSKRDHFSAWYQQLVVKSELIEFYDISGCYIFRPWSYAIWERIREFFDAEIKLLGVDNAYFPLFVSARRLESEREHVEGFAAEVAWVTRSGSSELEEPIAVRPTSETIMYPAMAKWIRSHRDLPLKLNQWSNVVRWEFKHPTPFIRSREFLWQEGHTAHVSREDADEEVLVILELYRRIYEELLAVPVIKGVKSDKERFAGGLYTTTIEAFVPANGRAIQAATSHSLGQNFAKMFDIWYEAGDGRSKAMPWQNSWGCTTRTIGVAVMVHGDDKGLVLPPRVTPVQVVVVPIVLRGKNEAVHPMCLMIADRLRRHGVRVKYDDRTERTPGWKFNHWELRGVPLRLEVGPRDIAAEQVLVTRRDTGEKAALPLQADMVDAVHDPLADAVHALLERVQADMLARATAERNAHIGRAADWEAFMRLLEAGHMVLTPWCNAGECEEQVKQRSGECAAAIAQEGVAGGGGGSGLTGAAKTLCLPFAAEMQRLQLCAADEYEAPADGKRCFACERPARRWALWGRSY